MSNGSILVIAFKFNDIIYSISTDEYKKSKYKHLIIFEDKINSRDFPFTSEFDSITVKKIPSGRINQIIAALRIRLSFSINKSYDTIITSNPFISLTTILISKFKKSKIILIEDGAMNYYSFADNNSIMKRIMKKVFSSKNIISKIEKTYLINPLSAKFYFGEKCKIDLDILNKLQPESLIINKLYNKKIFLGGGPIEFYPDEIKKKTTENLIDRFNIDIYIPHHTSRVLISKTENINLSEFGVTIETVMPMLGNSLIYTFGSSSVLNAKILNSNLKTILIKDNRQILDKNSSSFYDLMEKSCDNTIYI